MKNFDKLAMCDYINSDVFNDKRRKKAIFLDRDGTIHKDKVNTHQICDLEFFNDSFSAIKKLSDNGYIIVIISNQDGIAKRIYDTQTMHIFNGEIIEQYKANGIDIAAIYYSPHTLEENDYSFKPNPGMLIRAKKELNISMQDSYFIGDQVSDVQAGKNAKTNSLLVTTGIYVTSIFDNSYVIKNNIKIYSCLTECTNYILSL